MTIQYEIKIIRTLEVPDNLSIDEIDERVNEDMQNISSKNYTSLSIYYDSSKVINDNGEDEDDEDEDDENPLKAIIDAIIDEDKDFWEEEDDCEEFFDDDDIED